MPRTKCRNCGYVFEGNFCPNCGQNADVHRFSFSYFLRESFFSSLDIEKGLFATIKTLTTDPGKTIRDYLNGKRLSLAVPFKYLVIVGAIATFLSIKYKVYTDFAAENSFIEGLLPFIEHGFWVYAAEFTTVVNILAIPVFAVFSYLFFKPTGINFTENFILNTYISAHQLFLFIFFFPFIELFLDYKNEILSVYLFLTLVYNVWVYLTFFKLKYHITLVLTAIVFACAYVGQLILNYSTYLILDGLEILPHLKEIDL